LAERLARPRAFSAGIGAERGIRRWRTQPLSGVQNSPTNGLMFSTGGAYKAGKPASKTLITDY